MSRSLYARLAHRFADRRRTMTRREALKASAAGFAAVLAATRLGGCASDRSARMDAGRPARRPNGKSVIVVGAGFAGLACAYELLEFGYEVEVIEARERVGGRVLSFKDFVPGKVVEGGGELIGSNHFTWQAYAQQFGLRMLDVTSEDELAFPIRLNGRMLDESEAERLWYAMEAALSTMNDAAVPISADEPWNSVGATDLDRQTVSGWIDALDSDDDTKQALRVVMGSDNAVPVENQSLLGMLAQVAGGGGQAYWEDSEVHRCRGGNQQLADKLLDRIQGYRVLRGTPVASIEYESVAKVTLADGRVRAADYVVLAVPPSVWTRIFFVPLLPDRLAPQMGTALKYLSAVKGRYWRDLGLAPDSLTDGPVAMTWNGTDNQGGGNASLHVFSGGSAAQWLREGTRQEVDARVTRELESIYPGYEANLLADARGGPRRFMDWPGDEWCRGGYSFPAPGQLTRTGPILQEGIHRLRFCGEHTCPAFVGYMEGALRSGVLLAQRMALGDGSVAMPERMAAGV